MQNPWIAYHEGVDAFRIGLEKSDNPYLNLDQECSGNWNRGYLDAQEADSVYGQLNEKKVYNG